MKMSRFDGLSRRAFMAGASLTALTGSEPVIDIHQHTNYADRSNDLLVAHQRAMGVTKTVLLPAGSKYGLAVRAHGNDSVLELARQNPKEFTFFANELPDISETKAVLEKYLRLGAVGIGEQKFGVEADSKYIELIASIARAHGVPVLLHF
jgi:predicted TIM-barrel fold metal-dependent hydrolase